MKMKVGTRVVLTIYLIAVIVLCGFVLAMIAGLLPASNLTDFAYTAANGDIWFKILYAVIGIVVIIVSFMLMFFGLGKAPAPKTAQVATFESGSIVITVKAVEELVERFVHQDKNIKGLKTNVISNQDSLDINLDVSVLPEADIPQVTKDLQQGLSAHIQQHTGIVVSQVKIVVSGIRESTVRPA